MTDEATTRLHIALFGLPNVGWVHVGTLARSGQPTQAELIRLKDAGFASIINLREEHDESAFLKKIGLRCLYLPLPDHGAPSKDPESPQVLYPARFFAWVSDPANQPVLVHCGRGSGRTGLFCALLRYHVDRWKVPIIRREALRYRVPQWAAPWAIGWLDSAQKAYFRSYVRATGGTMPSVRGVLFGPIRDGMERGP